VAIAAAALACTHGALLRYAARDASAAATRGAGWSE
jgi:hypothetical protein